MQCPDCGSAMWDNRGDKRNPKSPDFKCKNRGCGKGVWEQRQNGNGGSSAHVSVPGASAPPVAGAALAPLYAECMEVASKSVKHFLGDTASPADVIAATATLFIQAAQSGRPIRVPKPVPAPVPPPPPPAPAYDDPYGF